MTKKPWNNKNVQTLIITRYIFDCPEFKFNLGKETLIYNFLFPWLVYLDYIVYLEVVAAIKIIEFDYILE